MTIRAARSGILKITHTGTMSAYPSLRFPQPYGFEALNTIVPEALALVGIASTRGIYGLALRAISACSAGCNVETGNTGKMYINRIGR